MENGGEVGRGVRVGGSRMGPFWLIMVMFGSPKVWAGKNPDRYH